MDYVLEPGAPQDITDIKVQFGKKGHLVDQATIRREKIYTQEALAQHINANLRVPYPFHMVHDNKILTPFSALFNPPNILELKIVYEHIRNKKKKESKKANKEDESKKKKEKDIDIDFKSFFEQRDIDIQEDIIDAVGFQGCIDKLKCAFTLPSDRLIDFKEDVWQTITNNEASKGSLIRKVIEFAIKSSPFLRIQDQFRVELDDRLVTADHAVLEMYGNRAILICEDKYSVKDLVEGLVQNFDQAKVYSLSKQGSKYPFVYGVISNFNEWRICCYYPPEPETIETKKNFYVSEPFTLMMKDFNPQGGSKEMTTALKFMTGQINELIGWIKGIFREDVDEVVSKILNLKIDLPKLKALTKEKTQKQRASLVHHQSDQDLLDTAPFLKSFIEGEGQKLLKMNE